MSPCDFYLHYSVSRVALYPVSYKSCSLFATSDVRFLLCNREFECLLDKPFDFFSHCFCISIGADDSDDEIVSKTTILEPTESRVKWVPAWIAPSKSLDAFDGSLDFLKLFFPCPLSLQGVIFLSETVNFPAVVLVYFVGSALLPLLKAFLNRFHEAV